MRAVLSTRYKGDEVLLRLEGIDSRDLAEHVKGHRVLILKSSLPTPETDEFYDFELLGMEVKDSASEHLGCVSGVEHPPAADVLIVELSTGEFVDIPLIEPFVTDIDRDGRTITAELPDELPRRSRR